MFVTLRGADLQWLPVPPFPSNMMPRSLVHTNTNPHAHKHHIPPWHSALIKKIQHSLRFMVPEGSFLFLQDLTTDLYSKLSGSLKMRFNIILLFTSRFFNGLFLADFPTKNFYPLSFITMNATCLTISLTFI
jgi:hypothetical protein